MKNGRVFYLEDEIDWIERVRDLLGDEYDFYSATSKEEAAQLFHDLAAEGLKIDLAIIDISLVDDPHDKQGIKFITALEETRVMPGHQIIVLSGKLDVDENWRVVFRDFDVLDTFNKQKFDTERIRFKQLINHTVAGLKS